MSLSTLYPSTPPSHPATVLTAHRTLFHHLVSTSQYQPFVYPYRALGPHILIAYLLLPPISPSKTPRLAAFVHHARWVVLAVVVWFCGWTVVECRSPMTTVGYGIGLINAWSVLWAWTLVVGLNARRGVGRVEMRGERVEMKGERMEGTTGVDGRMDGEGEDEIRLNQSNGDANNGRRRRKNDEPANGSRYNDGGRHALESSRFIWQGLPSKLRHRAHWVTDLVINFRGVRWSHQISGLPYPDMSSLQAFAKPISHQPDSITASSSPSPRSYPSRASLLRYNFISWIFTLLALDILKFVLFKDTYYWGVTSPDPSPFPLERTSRLILSLAAIYTSLNVIFLLSPLTFASPVGERLLGELAWPWLYPPLFGSPTDVWKHGLAGFWGGWWHQMFRLAFEQLGEFIAGQLGWEKKTVKGGLLRVGVAFLASGTLHACGSYTTLGDTRPAHAFLFFALQPVGLLTQRAVARWMKEQGLRDRIPASVRGAANLGLVLAWFWLTGPMVADDFARGGIWLYEPLPISPSRGLAGDGWWRWGGSWTRWHRDEKWWKSGWAL